MVLLDDCRWMARGSCWNWLGSPFPRETLWAELREAVFFADLLPPFVLVALIVGFFTASVLPRLEANVDDCGAVL